MEMKKLIESVAKFSGEPEQKSGEQVKSTDKSTKSKDGKHPFLKKLVGDSKIVKQKDADNAIVENLKKQFENFVPEEIDPSAAKLRSKDAIRAGLMKQIADKKADKNKSTKEETQNATDAEFNESVSKLTPAERKANRDLWDEIRNRNVVTDIDRERYTPIKGLEGPYRWKNGRVVYYDPREGKYYDRDQDMYIDDSEVVNENWESGPDERQPSKKSDPDSEYDSMRQRKADAKVKTTKKYYVYDGIQHKAVSDDFNTREEAINAREKIELNKPHLSIQSSNIALNEGEVSDKEFDKFKSKIDKAFEKIDKERKDQLKDEIRLLQLTIDSRKKTLNTAKATVVKESSNNKLKLLKEKYNLLKSQLDEVKARKVISNKLKDIESKNNPGDAFASDRIAKLKQDYNDYVDSNPDTIFKKKDVVDEAPKKLSIATRLKHALEEGDLMGIDGVSRSKEGNNTFIFRRGYFYTNGGNADKFAQMAIGQLKNAGFNPTLIDSGDIWKPFKGSASLKNSSHWWAKIQLNDEELVNEDPIPAPTTATPVTGGQDVETSNANPIVPVDPAKQTDAVKNAMAATTTLKTATGSSAPVQNIAKAIDSATKGTAVNAQDMKALEPMMNVIDAAAKDPKLANQFKTLASQANTTK